MQTYLPYLQFIDEQQSHMVHLLEKWSRINSGSFNLEGLAKMHAALSDNFSWLVQDSGEIEAIDLPPMPSVDAHGNAIEIPMGQALRVRKRPDAPIRVCLAGHMDTVFPKDHHFQTPDFPRENIMHGPGVADMKGGLLVMLKALEALERSPWAENIGWEVVINSDEEIGSQSSDFLLKQAAMRNHFGMLYEPSAADGSHAGARKGSGNFQFVVRGVAAHAGREFDKGRNAIAAASALVTAIDSLNGKKEGVTLNIGKIEGGGPLNAVPDLCIVGLNVRFLEKDDEKWIENSISEAILAILGQYEDIHIEKHGKFTRKPKPMCAQNQRLFDAVRACAGDLQQEMIVKASGGCCDGNNLYDHGLPNIDTLGVRGAHIHSDKEYLELDSLADRAKLSALLLMKVASGEVSLSESE